MDDGREAGSRRDAIFADATDRDGPVIQLLHALRARWLVFLVYFDALRIAPGKFLTAAKWFVLGKRVRARGQFAPLLSLSPRAYQLWIWQRRRGQCLGVDQAALPPLIALVDAEGAPDPRALSKTLACLKQQGIRAEVIARTNQPLSAMLSPDLPWSDGPWFLPMGAGDTLSADAVGVYRWAMNENQSFVIYADDDLAFSKRENFSPHFKPKWNAPLFENFDFITGACAVYVTQLDLAGIEANSDWMAHLVRKAVASSPVAPVHVPAMLHHRRARPHPVLPLQTVTLSAALPSVSVIIPTRNRVDLLRTCLAGLAKTRYPEFDVIVVDNGSDDRETLDFLAALDPSRHRVLRDDGPFNYSALNNRAISQAAGDLICLLNNDIEILDPDWLAVMATSAIRPDVGAVGARLLYPDGRIQHAGVVVGVGNAAGHAHRFLQPDETGYFSRHNLPQFVSAVTAACLVVMRERFLAVGMLNEADFPVAFNDVDLCLRLNARGWQSFYEPRATLVHHESVSRGHDLDVVGAARFASELAALQRKWHTDQIVDPYHHPNLSRASERLRWPCKSRSAYSL